MDTLYIGDIPEDFCYAVFSNDYITLYNTNIFIPGNNYNYYRIYLNSDGFYYSEGTTSISNYNNITAQQIEVSQNWMYRGDIDKIFLVTFIICILFIFVFNIVTSVFKKGGVFGGLL